MWQDRVIAESEKVFPYAVRIREQFHRNPELSFQEYRTSEFIQKELQKEGIPYSKVGDTGIVAVISGENTGSKKTIALRTDMDALPIQEETQESFQSCNGNMHACGHDMHSISIAAHALSRIQNGFVEEDTTINVGKISGGTGRNIVPERVTLSGEIRSMNHKKALYYVKQLENVLQQEAEKAGGRVEFSYHQHFQAYRILPEEEVAKRYQKACESQGIIPYFQDTFGGSDNNRFPERGIRGIVCSCAMNRVHTVQEYTSVQDMEKVVGILVALATDNLKEK